MTPKRAAISALTAVLVVVGTRGGRRPRDDRGHQQEHQADIVCCEVGEDRHPQRAPDHGGLHRAEAAEGDGDADRDHQRDGHGHRHRDRHSDRYGHRHGVVEPASESDGHAHAHAKRIADAQQHAHSHAHSDADSHGRRLLRQALLR